MHIKVCTSQHFSDLVGMITCGKQVQSILKYDAPIKLPNTYKVVKSTWPPPCKYCLHINWLVIIRIYEKGNSTFAALGVFCC